MLQVGSGENRITRASSSDRSARWALFAAIAACFTLSGFAALLYQTAWTRQFSLVFGTSEIAVATVLAAYMGGLALGALVVERFLERIRRPVLVYGFLELGIGLTAIAVPFLLIGAEHLLIALLGGQTAPPDSRGWAQTGFYLVTAVLVLVLPTGLMGATLPILTRQAVRTDEELGRRVGWLYALNTLGAVGGALVAAFAILPAFGLRATTFIGAIVNALVCALALSLSRSRALRPSHAEPAPAAALAHTRAFLPGPHWILPAMFLSGAVAFACEVFWTRLLSFVLGGSLQAFATMVATFLLGIALGSAAAIHFARTRARATAAFVVCQLAIAACTAGTYLALDVFVPREAGLRGNVPFAMLMLLPATLFIGATFPLAVRILAEGPRAAGPASARVLVWNTGGAIAGALLAGFFIIPALRFEGAVHALVIASVLIALLVAALVARFPLWKCGVVAVLAVAAGLAFRPSMPARVLSASPLHVPGSGELRFYRVGRSSSVVVLEKDGLLMMRTNGLPEAYVPVAGAAPQLIGEYWLTPLAVLARPRTSSMLIVGYGGGMAVDAVPPGVREIDVVEIEPEVIEANRAIKALRARDPLLDPRVNVVLNDARAALALTNKTYDAIVSQPSHPWTAGSSHLYTREFMQRVRARLAPGGVFVQWMNVSFVDERLLRSLAATFRSVFAHVRLYRPDPETLVFLGSSAPLDVEAGLLRPGSALERAPRHYARYGIHVPEDLVAALVADEPAIADLARGAAPLTDDLNRMATANAWQRRASLSAAALSRILAQYDPLQRRESPLASLTLDLPYLARQLAESAPGDETVANRIERMARLAADPATVTYVQALAARVQGDVERSARLLQEALAIDPANADVRFELIRPWLPRLAADRAPEGIRQAAEQLPAPVDAMLRAARHAAADEWKELPPLDAALESAHWTDPWYLPCLQLRIEWRVRVSTPELRARLGSEALRLVDEAIASHAGSAMYALRADSAQAADYPDAVLESIDGFAARALRVQPTGADERARLRASFTRLEKVVDDLAKDERIRESRRLEVRARIESGLRTLGEETGEAGS